VTVEKQVIILAADPRANYLAHKAEIDAAIARALDSGWYILGREVAAFEQEFAAYLGVRHAIGVASGTDALEIGLRACGIGVGDAVITVSHTAVATVAAIKLTGATPVLTEIDSKNFTMDPNCVEDIVRKNHDIRLRAIIPVHLYGHPADMPAIMDIANRYGLYVIEDCAQSHGAAISGRKTGAWGHLAAFSFYPTKNLGAIGDGGAVVTNDETLSDRMLLLREYGWRERYVSIADGKNSRLDEIQAAILRVKLSHLEEENCRRAAIAKRYREKLDGLPLRLPPEEDNVLHVYHQFVVRLSRRDELREHLSGLGIGTGIHYPMPVHKQPAYRERVRLLHSLEHTEKICEEILSLPMYPQLTDEQVDLISDSIRGFFE
jgi:dTDP-4-amino-4,6-dideoxygalactose transaminase